VANIQICGTLSCMIMGAEDLVGVCKRKIADSPHTVSGDGKFSWEEVECLGACCNAPMAQIGKDYYEDLTPERLEELIDELAAGKVPVPGPQNGRYGSEPKAGLTTLKDHEAGRAKYNASVELATGLGETVKRIDGTETPLRAPWTDQGGRVRSAAPAFAPPGDQSPTPDGSIIPGGAPEAPTAAESEPAEKAKTAPAPEAAPETTAGPAVASKKPAPAPKGATPDDLTRISGVGKVLAEGLAEHGITTFAQIAAWGPEEIAWADNDLAKRFKGRCTRDDWVAQAKELAKG
jgi:NADH-quinone oxidoreductase subunit E